MRDKRLPVVTCEAGDLTAAVELELMVAVGDWIGGRSWLQRHPVETPERCRGVGIAGGRVGSPQRAGCSLAARRESSERAKGRRVDAPGPGKFRASAA
jgi:hypothetical protein